jgi:hypothetical protein
VKSEIFSEIKARRNSHGNGGVPGRVGVSINLLQELRDFCKHRGVVAGADLGQDGTPGDAVSDWLARQDVV